MESEVRRKNTNKTCYMCKNIATSTEHVPPKCLFPEAKYLPAGVNLRKELITVPSCYDHNMQKSKDDEYLFLCLLSNFANNGLARLTFESKMLPAIARKPKLYENLMKHIVPVIVENSITKEAYKTYMIKPDIKRLYNSFEYMAKALYFKQYNERFTGTCEIKDDFTLSYGLDNSTQLNDSLHKDRKAVKDYFEHKPHAGDNPEVFRYLFEENGDVLRMQFYGGSNVYVAFKK
ncbi:MAG: hypothetical protein HQK92_15315 [Nitrospirae bacterium]|nr:hypothetical protein [Nitrospirota bacterium]